MQNLNICAELYDNNIENKKNITVMTAGATEKIKYNLSDKQLNINNILQLSFLFKQNKSIYSYNLKQYFKLTNDTVVKENKNYYNRLENNSSEPQESRYKFILQSLEVGEAIEPNTLYELIENINEYNTENWQIDNHFKYYQDEISSYIIFTLSSLETTQLVCNNLILCEIAITTNSLDEVNTAIEKQNSIIMLDSIYKNII